MPIGITTSHERLTPPTAIVRRRDPAEEKAKRMEIAVKLTTLVGLACLTLLGFGALSAGTGLITAGLAAPPLKILIIPGAALCFSSALTLVPIVLAVGLMIDLYKQYMNSRVEPTETAL